MHLSTARRSKGIFNPSKKTFSCDLINDRAMKERESKINKKGSILFFHFPNLKFKGFKHKLLIKCSR